MWQKHWIVFQRAFSKRIEYRSEIFIWVFLDIIPTAIILIMWMNLYQNRDSLNGYSLAQVLSYYVLVITINGLTASHFEGHRVKEVLNGKIDVFLTKPFSYIEHIFIDHLAGKVFYILLSLPFYLSLWFIFVIGSGTFPLTLNLTTSLAFLVLICFGFWLEFLFALIIVTLSFWFEGSEGLEHFKWIAVSLFSGSLIPLGMMPSWLATVTNWLPLKYMFAVPISVLQGIATLKWQDGLNMTLTLMAITLFSAWLWRKAQFRYSSAGG
jgi:ABC-2 type transport system permease protein